MQVKRGDIYFADLSPVVGSEQSGIRPVLIIQNDIGNKHSPTVIVIAITSKQKPNLLTHILVEDKKCGLDKDSVILTEQIRTLDKSRLRNKIGSVDNKTLEKVKKAIEISFGMRGNISWNSIDFNKYIK